MICPDTNQLQHLLEEDLAPSERASVETHVEQCRQCQETLDQLLDGPVVRIARRAETPNPFAGDCTRTGQPTGLADTVELQAMLAPPQVPDELGRLGGYRVLKLLGRGGMGAVFLAEDVQLRRRVALKLMRGGPAARERFLREARACAALKNDHVITIYQVGEDRGVPFLAMALLDGTSLDRWLESGPELTVPLILRIGREVATGLAAAHQKGLIHRDIKPANLWLDRDSGRVKILDFGLARGHAEEVQLTQAGMIVGTPAYMAPEQARAEAVDARCDVFSLGCVLYQLCTGQLPFKGKDTMSILLALVRDTPQPVRALNADIPQPLADLVMQMLAKDPAQRPQTARLIVQMLTTIEGSLQAVSEAPMAVPVAPAEAARPADANQSEPSPQQVVPPETPLPMVLQKVEARPAASPETKAWPSGAPLLSRPWFLIGVAAVVLVGGALAGWVIIRDKGGKEVARVQVPEGGSVEVPGTGKDLVQPAKSDADARALLEWIRSKSNNALAVKVEEAGEVRWLKDQMPKGPFKLRAVNLYRTYTKEDITDQDLARLAAFPDIESLNLSGEPTGQPITAAGLAQLTPLKGLKRLTLRATKVTPAEGAGIVRGFAKLEYFHGEASWVPALEGMPSLRMLEFYRQSLTRDVLDRFKGFPNLACVFINDGQTSEKDMVLLKDARKLRLLLLRKWSGGDDVLRRLAKEMPECEIWRFDDSRPPLVWNAGKGAEFYALAGVSALASLPAIEEAWFKQVATLPTDKQVEAVVAKLKDRNPGFDGQALPGISGGTVTALRLIKVDTIRDLAPVRALPGLRSLECSGTFDHAKNKLTDLSPLKGMALSSLIIARMPIEDLTPLKDMLLTNLDISKTKVSNLSPLKGMKLANLYCSSTPVSDLSPLKDMPLTTLDCSWTNVADLSPLKGMPLTNLVITFTSVTDLSPLRELPLKELECPIKPERDAAILRSIKTLEKINRTPAAEFWKAVDAGQVLPAP